jgi:hypothetical protein
MTRPLSPAAQAVLTKLTQHEYGLDPADVPQEAARMARLAGITTRALADQAGSAKHWHVNQLHELAAELESMTDD